MYISVLLQFLRAKAATTFNTS